MTFSDCCWGHTAAVLLGWPFPFGKTSLGEARMLFYLGPRPAPPLPPARSWGGARRTKSHKILHRTSWVQGLCKIVAHCYPKSPKVAHKAAQGTKMVVQSSLLGAPRDPFPRKFALVVYAQNHAIYYVFVTFSCSWWSFFSLGRE